MSSLEVGAQRVGISADKVDKQAALRPTKHSPGLPAPVRSRPDGRPGFGVKRPGPIMNKRATFVIGTDQKILAAISSELNMDLHADEALVGARRLVDVLSAPRPAVASPAMSAAAPIHRSSGGRR